MISTDIRTAPARSIAAGVVVAGAAAIWFVHLTVSYALVPYRCRSGNDWPMHVVTLVSLAALAAVWVLARRRLRPTGAALAAIAYFGFVVAMTGLVPVFVERCA